MNVKLYLVRHAIAVEREEYSGDDSQRPLTPEGVSRFRRVVKGLDNLDVRVDLIITSPLVRARHTADLLSEGLSDRPIVTESGVLVPGRPPADVVEDVMSRDGIRSIALVGHEPGLGLLAAHLIGARTPLPFKKGGVCRIDVNEQRPGGGTLRWFVTPRILRTLA